MKKLLIVALLMGTLALAACSYHAKQPVNDAYYKKTRQVEWPEKAG